MAVDQEHYSLQACNIPEVAWFGQRTSLTGHAREWCGGSTALILSLIGVHAMCLAPHTAHARRPTRNRRKRSQLEPYSLHRVNDMRPWAEDTALDFRREAR